MTMLFTFFWASAAVTSFTLSSLIAGGKISKLTKFKILGYSVEYSDASLWVWALVCGALLSGPGVYMFNKAMLVNKEIAVSTMIVLGPISGLVLAYYFGANIAKPLVWLVVAGIILLGLLLENLLKG